MGQCCRRVNRGQAAQNRGHTGIRWVTTGASRGQAAQHRGQTGVMQHSREVRKGSGNMAEASSRVSASQHKGQTGAQAASRSGGSHYSA